MRTIFVDTNVVIDLLEKREPFYKDAVRLFTLAYKRKLKVYVSGCTFTTASYLLRKHSPEEMKTLLKNLRQIANVSPIDEVIIDNALISDFNDYEDTVQHYSAVSVAAEAIVTRNEKDFIDSSQLPVMSPQAFLAQL